MKLASIITFDWIERAVPFLRSLSRLRVPCHVVGYGFDSSWLTGQFPGLHFVSLPRHPSESCGMLQHGRWVDAFDEEDDPVWLLCDADIVVQRDFTEAELARLEAMDVNTVAAAWNAGPDDTLLTEARRIGLNDRNTYADDTVLGAIPVYNCGILAMRRSLWRKLQAVYEPLCLDFYQRVSHRARCQWLICWCLKQLGVKVELLGGATHSIGHLGVPAGVMFRDGLAYHHDSLILFRHCLNNKQAHEGRWTGAKNLYVELGGGRKTRGAGWINIDRDPGADIILDLERDPLPLPDDCAASVYSSHCLEHLDPYGLVLHEIVRICRAGASVELRVPHYLSDMAMCAGHKHTLGPTQVRHWCQDFVADWWRGCRKRLRHLRTDQVRGHYFDEARQAFPNLSPEQLMQFIPGAAHEVAYYFEVVRHEG